MPKPVQLDITDESKRLVSGWASVEILDSQGDIVPIDQMKRSMFNLMDRGGNINYEHTNKPIGKILQWEVAEHPDSKAEGIKFVAKIFEGYEHDDQVWKEIKNGHITGFSIGAQGKSHAGVIKDESTGESHKVNILSDLDLMEISAVEEPANEASTIDGVNYVAKSKEDLYKLADIISERMVTKGYAPEGVYSNKKESHDYKVQMERIQRMEAMTGKGMELKTFIEGVLHKASQLKYMDEIHANSEDIMELLKMPYRGPYQHRSFDRGPFEQETERERRNQPSKKPGPHMRKYDEGGRNNNPGPNKYGEEMTDEADKPYVGDEGMVQCPLCERKGELPVDFKIMTTDGEMTAGEYMGDGEEAEDYSDEHGMPKKPQGGDPKPDSHARQSFGNSKSYGKPKNPKVNEPKDGQEIDNMKSTLTSEEVVRINTAISKASNDNNAFAICTAQVGREDPEKFESCVRQVKGQKAKSDEAGNRSRKR